MSKTRVAMVACTSSLEGLWTRAKGNEVGIRIIHLVDGEHIELVVEIAGAQHNAIFTRAGVFPLPWERFDKYRVNKRVNPGVDAAPTTVEIELNGTAKDLARNPLTRYGPNSQE